MAAFLLPTAGAVIYVQLRGLCVRHPIDQTSALDVLPIYEAIMLWFMALIVGVHATVLAGLFGLLSGRAWAAKIVPLMLGCALIGIGNLLPRTRPNLAIGIRTRAALADRALWIRLHRSAGYLVVASGTVVVLAALAAPVPIGSGMVLLVGPAALVGTCVLVRYFHRHAHVDL